MAGKRIILDFSRRDRHPKKHLGSELQWSANYKCKQISFSLISFYKMVLTAFKKISRNDSLADTFFCKNFDAKQKEH